MSGGPSRTIRSVTFDLDGTLLDTVADLAAACDAMMIELGRAPHGVDQVRCFVGRGMAVLVERCLTTPAGPPEAALLARGIELFRRHYSEFNGRDAAEYPDVRAGLQAFQHLGLPLAVVTNKPAAFTAPLLERTGLADFFSVTVAGDTTTHKKPHPEPILHACHLLGAHLQENLHIGDSDNDLLAARAAGCLAFAVPYGYTEAGPVDTANCDALVSTLLEAAQRVASYNESISQVRHTS
ncbi:MAG: phosphoglycolate phosphatase [Zoogloeaceae bacterium]|nr:phosphoglycolate phosphatase [Zoogloeaceae bacterium]